GSLRLNTRCTGSNRWLTTTTKPKHSTIATRPRWPQRAMKLTACNKLRPTKRQNSTPRVSNCIARASNSCGQTSHANCLNYKPKNNAHVTMDSSNAPKLNTLPAPTAQNSKPGTEVPCRVQTRNDSQAPTRSATSTGCATQLTDKPTSTSLPTRP